GDAPGAQAGATRSDPPQVDPQALEQAEALQAAVGTSGTVSTHDETGLVTFVGTAEGDPIPRSPRLAPSGIARGGCSRVPLAVRRSLRSR
ncbi:MAG: hypothetical protein M5U19_16370, partial [Microthrixaceae bacterium]|nr:hypothetical protein [Microthrixaceae bacterium]